MSLGYSACWRLQLKVVDWHNNEKASDALSINGYEHYQATDYSLEVYYKSGSASAKTPKAKEGHPADFTKWWKDGDEPSYYLVCPKVRATAIFDLESSA